MLHSARFSHIVFPIEKKRQKLVNLGAASEAWTLPADSEPSISTEDASFCAWLFSQAGLDARSYRNETLQRRLAACLRALRAGTPAQARRRLEAYPELIPSALSAMLVGVTSFFRDSALFEALEKEIVPALAGARSGLYIWSVGCSDGAELYSLAAMLAGRGLLSSSYLLGTDCRTDAIERAKNGCYDAAAVKNVPPDYLRRYFIRDAAAWRVSPELRQPVRWRMADILKGHEPGLWDIILFRNTAMYLRTEASAALWERFEQSLRPGGILVLGKAERPMGAKRLLLIAPCMYRRMRR